MAKAKVALHPEGVDRNAAHWSPDKRYSHVALHPEGVDRNWLHTVMKNISPRSPSTRRAWIEINRADYKWGVHESPSTRRAWIEIFRPPL